jgi:hypothetical protein
MIARVTFFFLLVLEAWQAPLHAQWQLVSESAKQEIGPAIWQVHKKVKGREELELNLVFFDMKNARARLVAQTARQRFEAKTLTELAVGTGAVAGWNCGYFTPEFGPSGLEIAQGVRAGTWQQGLPFGGVLCVQKGTLALLPDSQFRDDPAITDLVQSCPMLIQKGAVLSGIGGMDQVARTFIATDGAGKWVGGFCARAALGDLADVLIAREVLHEFRVESALNLDGGPSSGIWWKPHAGGIQGVRATTRVRNAMIILPK